MSIVTEYVLKINGHPVASGSKMKVTVALQNALTSADNEGRPEPTVEVIERTVDYSLPVVDQVTETVITL
jgi:hypothetical protein